MPEYIYREAFEEDVRLRYCKDCTKRQHEIYCRSCWVDDMLGEVEDAPAADVEVARRGRWADYECAEPYGDDDAKVWYKCSECGKDALGRCLDDEWYSSPILSKYCPNCGAKMDGKGDDK